MIQWTTFSGGTLKQNPAYWRHWISWRLRIVAQIPKRTEKKKKTNVMCHVSGATCHVSCANISNKFLNQKSPVQFKEGLFEMAHKNTHTHKWRTLQHRDWISPESKVSENTCSNSFFLSKQTTLPCLCKDGTTCVIYTV